MGNLSDTALYLVATLPEEERTKEHTTSSGETKTPAEIMVWKSKVTQSYLKGSYEFRMQIKCHLGAGKNFRSDKSDESIFGLVVKMTERNFALGYDGIRCGSNT